MVLARKDCRDPSMGLANAHVFHRIVAMHGRSCVKNCFSKCHSRQSPMCLTLSQTMRKNVTNQRHTNKSVNGVLKASGRAISGHPPLE